MTFVISNTPKPSSNPAVPINTPLTTGCDTEPTNVHPPPMIQAMPAGKITILERIFPLDPAAMDAMIGIHIAIVPELERNALISVQIITTDIMNTRSFFASGVAAIFAPSFWATPVWNRASPTIHMPATITTVLPPNPE